MKSILFKKSYRYHLVVAISFLSFFLGVTVKSQNQNNAISTDTPNVSCDEQTELESWRYVVNYEINNLSLLQIKDFLNKNPWKSCLVDEPEFAYQLYPKYKQEDFDDNTPWELLLHFPCELSTILGRMNIEERTRKDNTEYWKECTRINSISILFLSGKNKYFSFGEDFDNYIEGDQLSIEIIDPKILRAFEMYFRSINMKTFLITELPPGSIYPDNQEGYPLGTVVIKTTEGNFTLTMLSHEILLGSEWTKMKYPFYSQGITMTLDYILYKNNGKHIPKYTTSRWSGEERISHEKELFDDYINGTASVDDVEEYEEKKYKEEDDEEKEYEDAPSAQNIDLLDLRGIF
jgi:hypothetical protein